MSCPAFLHFWWDGRPRNTFLSFLPKEDLASLRLACHDFSVRAAPVLFKELTVTFRASIFTKPARMAALDRIGHHVRTFEFRMPHGPETFLPPLLDPSTCEQVTFIYEPYVQAQGDSPCRLSIPTYGSWEMTDMLVKQYPPLFHAAANVPSFIRALSSLSSLEHLKISCPGQEAGQHYRRSIVDYALISLRIAVERSKLPALNALTLTPVHAGAVLYLNPTMGFGALPNSTRRWRQIKTLTIEMDSVPFAPNPPADHLKTLNAYLQVFTPSAKRLTFRWLGSKGLCPLTLHEENCLQDQSPKLACPRRSHIALPPLKFRKLRDMEVENIIIDASQISSFISIHRRTLSDFKFEDTKLRSGTWDQALKPLTRISGSEKWKEKSEEVMDVPLMLSPLQQKVQAKPSIPLPSNNCISTMSLKSDAFPSSEAFEAISSSLQSDDAGRKDAVKKGNAIFSFTLKNKEGQSDSWHIDLKDKGVVAKGEAPDGKKADVFLSLSDDDFGKLASGKTQAQRLFMSGKLKIRGDIMKATKMEPILKKAQTKPKL